MLVTPQNTAVTPGAERAPSSDAVNARSTLSVMDAVDITLDLGASSRDLIGTYNALSKEDQPEYLRTIAQLLQIGIVGTEMRDVHGAPRKVIVEIAMMDRDLQHAPLHQEHEPHATGVNRFA